MQDFGQMIHLLDLAFDLPLNCLLYENVQNSNVGQKFQIKCQLAVLVINKVVVLGHYLNLNI